MEAEGVRPRVGRFDGVSRCLAVGDVQGNYGPLLALLGTAGFASERDGLPVWTGETGTLLFLGDLVDGGAQPAEVLWLVLRLHEQARAAGGQVLLVQGNHELMLFEAMTGPVCELPLALARWFANGGLETLLRLAASVKIEVPERLVSQMYTARLSEPEGDPEVQSLARTVRSEYAPELDFLQRQAHAAVVVNGSLLAVHAAPNFQAQGLPDFARNEREESGIAWSRAWLDDWQPGATEGPFVERVAGLRRRLHDRAAGIDLRLLLFAHTGLPAFAVPGFRERQFRVGRLVGPDARPDVPAVYDLLTAPREVPPGGALGGLLLDRAGVTAVYGDSMHCDGRIWPSRERLDEPDPDFLGSRAAGR